MKSEEIPRRRAVLAKLIYQGPFLKLDIYKEVHKWTQEEVQKPDQSVAPNSIYQFEAYFFFLS